MHATTLFVLAAAGLAAAQSSAVAAVPTLTSPATSGSTSLSGCGTAIDAIISNCLNTENTQLAACQATDWDCMCAQIINVVTCYNNCPTDPNAFAATQRQTSYCNAAKQFGSKASASSTAAVTSAVSGANVAAVATTASSSSSTASTSSSTASPTHNGIAHLAVPAGGAIAAFFGLAALL